MKRLNFSIDINASVIKVYDIMLGKDTFKQWTAVFNPTSDFEGSWEKGETIHFVGVDNDGNKGGMIGVIKENVPLEHVSIYYIGIVDKGQEITEGPLVEEWANAYENYYYRENENITTVSVEIDSNDKMVDYFNTHYPQALEKLKQMCES